MENENEEFVPAETISPLKYEIGEICKCYFTEIVKNHNERVSQQINKCQGFCRIVSKNPSDKKEYVVRLFDSDHTEKKLPGCCLRKCKVIPFEKDDAIRQIGRIVETENRDEIMMIVAVNVDDDGTVNINDIDATQFCSDFVFHDTGAPAGKIVMLKADEAFV